MYTECKGERRREFECYVSERHHIGGFEVLRTRYVGLGGFATAGEKVDGRVFEAMAEAQAEADRLNIARFGGGE